MKQEDNLVNTTHPTLVTLRPRHTQLTKEMRLYQQAEPYGNQKAAAGMR